MTQNVSRLQLELLCFVADKYEPDVTALQEEYERWHDTDVTYQSVYQALERLDSLGFVEKKSFNEKSNCYMLTEGGVEFLDSHRKLVLNQTSQVKEALE